MKSGMSKKPMPGVRMRCTVAIKLMPVRMEDQPMMKAARIGTITLSEVFWLYGT